LRFKALLSFDLLLCGRGFLGHAGKMGSQFACTIKMPFRQHSILTNGCGADRNARIAEVNFAAQRTAAIEINSLCNSVE
jgi:hypothetical protein